MQEHPLLESISLESELSRRRMLQAAGVAVGLGVVGGAMLDAEPAAAAAGYTYNGWEIIASRPDPRLTSISVAGLSATVRVGAIAAVLQYTAQQFHARVEAVTTFSGHRTSQENSSSGGYSTSNHMSGTAIDLNGYKHPYKKPHGFSAAQVGTIDQICAETRDVVYWGGYFGAGLMDGMHFEIRTGKIPEQITAAAAALGAALPAMPNYPAAPLVTEKNMRLIRIIEDGRIILITPIAWTHIGDTTEFVAWQKVLGVPTDVSIVEAARTHDRIAAHIGELADAVKRYMTA